MIMVGFASILIPMALVATLLMVGNFQEFPPTPKVYIGTWFSWAIGFMCLVEAVHSQQREK